jgi:hypothetical protein
MKLFAGDEARAERAIERTMKEVERLEEWATETIYRQKVEDIEAEFEEKRRSGSKYVDQSYIALAKIRELEALEHLKPFAFGELPVGMREGAKRTMAMAYLVANYERTSAGEVRPKGRAERKAGAA